MKVAEEFLKEQLEEMYTYYFAKRREFNDIFDNGTEVDEDTSYEVGKIDGAIEAISAIYLLAYGGKEMFSLWTNTLETGSDVQS